jgi:hypothetical protein
MNIITLKSSYLVSNAWLLVINLFLPNLSGLRKRIGILKVSLEPIHKSFFINNWIYFWEGYELGLISTEKILTLVRADPNFRRILFFFWDHCGLVSGRNVLWPAHFGCEWRKAQAAFECWHSSMELGIGIYGHECCSLDVKRIGKGNGGKYPRGITPTSGHLPPIQSPIPLYSDALA